MNKIVCAALLVTALPVLMPAQEAGGGEGPRPRNARPNGEAKPKNAKRQGHAADCGGGPCGGIP